MSDAPRVLVVDDDREIVDVTALLLRGAGYRVEAAGSGEEALYAIQERQPELVLLDINMPGMDGWEVLRILKEDERTAELPIVVFSVNFEIREKLRALQLGARDYVTKPFDTEGLLRRLADIVASAARRGHAPGGHGAHAPAGHARLGTDGP